MNFMAGKYDMAVVEAFREVEIAVREAGRYDKDARGRPLMGRAFNKADGPLTDQEAPVGERESMAALFGGAIGVFRNPGSHRRVAWDSAIEAAEAIGFASLLLRMVERLTPRED